MNIIKPTFRSAFNLIKDSLFGFDDDMELTLEEIEAQIKLKEKDHNPILEKQNEIPLHGKINIETLFLNLTKSKEEKKFLYIKTTSLDENLYSQNSMNLLCR